MRDKSPYNIDRLPRVRKQPRQVSLKPYDAGGIRYYPIFSTPRSENLVYSRSLQEYTKEFPLARKPVCTHAGREKHRIALLQGKILTAAGKFPTSF